MNRTGGALWLASGVALLFSVLAAWGVPVARAQDVAVSATTAVAAEPLSRSLAAFSRQTGLQVVYVSAAVSGVLAKPPPIGVTAREALVQMLEGTNLTFEYLNARTVRIFSISSLGESANDLAPQNGARESNANQGDDSLNTTAQAPSHQGFWSRVVGFFTASKTQLIRKYSNSKGTTAILLCGSLAATCGASAQTPPQADSVESLEEVIVSGSRIQRPGFTSPTPVTTIDAAMLDQRAQVNIANVLNDIPAFRPTVTETSAAQTNTQVGANYADLRGLGSLRTLVLMNGERFVPQIGTLSPATSNQVDLNVFPSIAIQRVDVVTGGASSAWGSDAIAGVVNLQMYKRYQGIKFDLQTGVSDYNDNRSNAVQMLAGTSLFGDRVHAVVAGAWSKNDGVGDMANRPWGEDRRHVMRDTARCATCWLSGDHWQNITSAPGGVIAGSTGGSTTALNDIAFGVGGVPYAMPQGYFRSGTDGIFGGTVPNNEDGYLVPLKAPSTRANFYSNFEVDFTDSLKGFVTLNYSDRKARQYTNTMIITYTILSGNPFIPPSIQAQMTTRGISSIRVGVKHNDILTPPDGPNGYQVNGKTRRVSAGFDWQLGDDWSLDGYATYGDNHGQNFAPNQRNFANVAQAQDAILGANGAIVCRNPANGCVPINIFGVGSPSPAALNFITSDQELTVDAWQRAAALNLNGTPFSTWAGPVAVAAGVEYRKESKHDNSDPLTLSGAMNNSLTPTLGFRGELDVKEGYLEAAVPLLSDVPAVRSFELNAAYRTTDYSTFGRENTWKAGAIWKIVDPLLFRATVSRDLRAPTVTELFAPQTRTSGTTVPGQVQPVDVFSGGNPTLQPEVADSMLFGLTFRPSESFGATLDYYDIDIENVVFNANASAIINGCLAGSAVACASWIRDDPANPTRVTRLIGGNTNVANLTLRGFDAEVFLNFGLGNLPGKFDLRAQGSYADKLAYQTAAGQPFKDYAGQNTRGLVDSSPFWAPRFKGSLSMGYSLEGFSGNLVANYLSSGVNQIGLTTTEFAENEVPAYWKLDLNLGYRFGSEDQYQVYGNVRNLLDKDPLFVPVFAIDIPTSPLYDTVGRTYLLGVRVML
jgi:iron complex outermembrane receptor protein